MRTPLNQLALEDLILLETFKHRRRALKQSVSQPTQFTVQLVIVGSCDGGGRCTKPVLRTTAASLRPRVLDRKVQPKYATGGQDETSRALGRILKMDTILLFPK